MKWPLAISTMLALGAAVGAVKISDIQGAAFQSPLAGQWVHNVTGVVTAKVSRSQWPCFIKYSGFRDRIATDSGYLANLPMMFVYPVALGCTLRR